MERVVPFCGLPAIWIDVGVRGEQSCLKEKRVARRYAISAGYLRAGWAIRIVANEEKVMCAGERANLAGETWTCAANWTYVWEIVICA